MKTIQVEIPSLAQQMQKLPDPMKKALNTSLYSLLRHYYQEEIAASVIAAQEAIEGSIVFPYFYETKRKESDNKWYVQFQCFFECKDLALPTTRHWNWHGQETSQWVYAGGIVISARWDGTEYSDVSISTNH